MNYKIKKEMMTTFQIIYLFHSYFHKIQIRVNYNKKINYIPYRMKKRNDDVVEYA